MITKAQLQKQHHLYQKFSGEFKKFREAFSGGIDFKNSTNVRKFFSDKSEDYINILGITPTTNLCRHMIETRVNQVFETQPKRKLYFAQGSAILDIETTPGLRSFIDDATFQGSPFNDFMEEVSIQSSIYGHCWVLVEKPAEKEINPTDFTQNRPYSQIVLPQQVIDWEFEFIGGREVLTSIKIILNETDEEITYYVAELQDDIKATVVRTYCVEKSENDKKEIQPETEVFLPEGMGIPCVKVYAKKDPANKLMGMSDIRDAVYFQRFIANLDREAYESIIYKKSILKLPTDIQTPEGGGLGIVRGEIDELEAVDFAVPDTADVDSVRAYIDNVIERYSKINGIQTQTGTAARSGESFYQERQDLYRAASAKARNLELAEINIFMLFAHWQGLKFAGLIEYDTEYSERDTELKMFNLKTAKELAPDSPLINAIIERELVKIIGSTDDQKAQGLMQEYKPTISELPTPFDERDTPGEEDLSDNSRNIRQIDNGNYDERVFVLQEQSLVKP
jgi:hypothetical protein